MKYARIYADEAGESHFEDVPVELSPVDYAPPAPSVNLSVPQAATALVFMSAPPGWDGDWHPTPRRQIVFYLAGEVEVEASDGERRRFGPGGATLGEDTTGKGHRSRVVGEVEALLAVVQLAD
jgi:quercetin dioxygenase-like cupin family protein